jgi:NAD(P)-dependent dehydrogenase (short-subunit alcohol dehydrogenase family)
VSRAWHDLSGKVAIVIGASRGLGHEAALALARAGADVACCGRTVDGLRRTAADIKALGRRAPDVVVDVTEGAAVEAAFDRIVRELGALDVLVSAAGVMHAAPTLKTTVEDWDRVVRVNLTGSFTAACAAARQMQERGGRIILFGTSFVGPVLPLTAAYGASKAGLHQLARSLAVEWARYGITVNVVAPGYFETEMPRAVLGDPELRQRVLARIPLRRVGIPSEIGPLINYLASDASGFMTGAVLRIDGGQAINVS